MRNFSDFSLRAAIPVAAALLTFSNVVQAASQTLAVVGPPSVLAVADTATDKDKKDDALDEVVVTGSLIPQARAEISTPVTVITADDIQAKGFVSVADALQHTSFATGSVQGAQSTNGFTPGAETLSLFGLSPSYTKYLIDGRPLADYPALYNGSEAITSLSGIPTLLVDHIDLLPGAQSSIYGSDAIAGVINIILKKKMDGPSIDARYGWTKGGGGVDKRLEIADGFNVGNIHVIVGAQYEKVQPIWGYQRSITSQNYANGSSPQEAALDYVAIGIFGRDGNQTTNLFYQLDPANCANVASQFNGTTTLATRPGQGQFCGSTQAGQFTLNNGTESTQGYLHASDDINEHLQIFADVLIDHDWAEFSNGPGFFYTGVTNTFNNYYDPNLQDYMSLQHIFSPEEAGGLNNTLNKNTTNSIRATLGAQGTIVGSWTYAADFTYTENKLTEDLYSLLTAPLESYFAANVFGPNLGPDPNGFGEPTYTPNYANFYKPVTPAQWASFNGNLNSYSRTEESLARLQITNPSLFELPGGNAGIAVVGDGGGQGWNYAPDADFFNGGSYLYTAVAGSGHRSRYSGTVEMRLPVVKMLTFDLSGRYDDYKVLGENIDKATYNAGIEFRPLSQVMLRGRYGTAFKAPTLADEFQGLSGFFTDVTDYYQCATEGFTGATISKCPQANVEVFGQTKGDPTLKPTTAKVYDIGIVLQPFERFTFTSDFIHWQIKNEIQAPFNNLLSTESGCRSINGAAPVLDPASPTCVTALSDITRDQFGNVSQIYAPKLNVAEEDLNVFTASLDYLLTAGVAGNFVFQAAYSDLLKHNLVQFAGDLPIDLIENPFFSEDFKSKENVSVTWNFHSFGTTLYVERYGRTPNYLAYQNPSGYDTPGGGRVGTWTLANLSAKYEIIPGLIVSANVVNLFDKAPPVDNSVPGNQSVPYLNTNYNPYGRSFNVEASYKFGKF